MATLTPRQVALLERLPREQRFAHIGGMAASLAGVLYIVWAVACFEPGGDPVEAVGFDAPIVMPVAALYGDAGSRLASLEIDTPRERALAWRLHRVLDFSAGLFLLAFRVILGLLVAFLGFAALTVMIERRRLLGILEAQGLVPPPVSSEGGPAPRTAFPPV